jgi:hypothetical protein
MHGKAYRYWAGACVVLLVFALGGCKKDPPAPEDTRPDWSASAIDGIAPLMKPEQIRAALDQYGYRQIPCGSDDKMNENALFSGDGLSCYRSASRPMRVTLNFIDIPEGRRLENAFFREGYDLHASDAERLVSSRAYADTLQARFGKPFQVTQGSSYTTFYWRVPGGVASLPDMISSSSNWPDGANVTLTTMWAGTVKLRAAQKAGSSEQ